MGVGNVLKQKHPDIKLVAVEPEESAVLSGGSVGMHGIYGIGDGFIPTIVKTKEIDDIIRVSTKEAVESAKLLIRKYGLLVGISSGANFAAAKKLAVKYKNIVTVFPDRAERYLSTDLFNNT